MSIKHNYKNRVWVCQCCGKEFKDSHACLTRIPKFCSRSCSAKVTSKILTPNRLKALAIGRLSKPSPRKGKHLPIQHIKNISAGLKGKKLTLYHRNKLSLAKIGKYRLEKSPTWKGDDVGYGALHEWVYQILGNPLICKHCGNKFQNNRQIHWANKSGLYKREKSDWIRLCVSCHKLMDYERIINAKN